MASEDRYGLSLSTSSEAAAEAYREGIDRMLSAWPGAAAALDARSKPMATSRWPMRRARASI